MPLIVLAERNFRSAPLMPAGRFFAVVERSFRSGASVLRQHAGQSVYPVNVADKLLAMNHASELPVEQSCLRCQIGTRNILDCSACL